MKVRLTLAAVLVTIGLGVFCVCRQSKSSVTSPSAQPESSLAMATVVPTVATGSSGAAVPSLAFDVATNQTETVRGTRPYVLTSVKPVGKSFLTAVGGLGARVVAHLDAKRVLVEADAAVVRRLSADSRVASLEERLPAAKVDADLARKIAAGAQTVDATVIALAAEDRARLEENVIASGGEILTGCLTGEDNFKARLSVEVVARLAARGDVQWLEAFERPRFLNDVAVDEEAMNVRSVWQSLTNPGGLSGAGQVVTTSDSGIDTGKMETLHEDLRDRVVGIKVAKNCYDYDKNGHGTHTAGSIVGNGTKSDGQIRGTAWGAKLYAWFCGGKDGTVRTPDTELELFRPDQENYPAYIHSASWGSDTMGKYTSECAGIDNFVWKHPDFLPVFAAGNAGDYGSQTVGSPAASKNVLAVGATQNLRTEPPQPPDDDDPLANGDPEVTGEYSSRGPCADGRIKPDIAAPGTGILSTRAAGVDYEYGIYDDDYAYSTGTSMACPLTAGAVALVREWLVDRKGFDDPAEPPTAALMKAVITGGAKGAAKPNNEQGWGRVDLSETLFPSNRAVKLIDRIPFAEGAEFTWVVETTNAAPLDVQLVWIDYPASSQASSTQTLINDLDLTVEAVIGNDLSLWYGNGGTSADRKNNVESVRLESAVPTKYVITVSCPTVLYDDGGAAALYVRGAFDPEANPEAPRLVQIKERDLGFRSFARAVKEVAEGETIEILNPITLEEPVTLGVSCTVVATNENPDASAVNCLTGAGLVVSNDVRVLFRNVVFTNAASVAVAAGGTAALAGTVEFGVVTTSDATGIELAGPLSRNVPVRSPNTKANEPFGTFSCSYPEASGSAMFFENLADDELGGIAKSETGELVWGVAEVPDAAAVVRLSDGGTTQNFRSLRALFKHVEGDGEIAVFKDCTLSAPTSVSNKLTLVGRAPSPKLTVENDGGFVIVGGSLAVSNLTMTGSTTEALFQVGDYAAGRDGTLILGRGATVREVIGKNKSYGGVVCLWRGRATLGAGSQIVGCVAAKAWGGGVYAYGENATVALEGGSITGCSALMYGGGVYSDNDAPVQVCGATCVKGNLVGGTENDIYCWDSVQITGPVTSPVKSIGVAVDECDEEGDTFAAYDGSTVTDPEAAAAATAFFNTRDSGLEAAVDTENRELYWTPVSATKTVDESLASVRVVYPDATTNYYATLGIAFSDLQGDCRVELMKIGQTLNENMDVDHSVLLTSDPKLMDIATLDRISGTITVTSGAALTVSNLCLSGWCLGEGVSYDFNRLIFVQGGSLVLEKDGGIQTFDGDGSRDASAIVVYQGTFTMKDGSYVDDCRNGYVDEPTDTNTGTGGGVLIDVDSTAYLSGGKVINCGSANGGIAICNRSTAYVSGTFCATGNTDLAGKPSDLLVEDGSTVVLAAPLASDSEIGHVMGYRVLDTNLVAVVPEWTCRWTAAELKADAAKFFSDEMAGVSGVAVTNASKAALVVWSTALDAKGAYVDSNDPKNVYYPITDEPPTPPPGPTPALPTPIAFKTIVRETDTVTLVVTDAVQWCWYSVFATNALEGGFAITNTAGQFIVKPITNFQWKTDGKEIELKFPANDDRRFFKATAAPGTEPPL